jgi:hypothetical protein
MKPNTPEPPPIQTDEKPVWDMVIEDMRRRDHEGRRKYGTPLQAGNGRHHLVDAYQEALDLVVYLRAQLEAEDAEQDTLEPRMEDYQAIRDILVGAGRLTDSGWAPCADVVDDLCKEKDKAVARADRIETWGQKHAERLRDIALTLAKAGIGATGDFPLPTLDVPHGVEKLAAKLENAGSNHELALAVMRGTRDRALKERDEAREERDKAQQALRIAIAERDKAQAELSDVMGVLGGEVIRLKKRLASDPRRRPHCPDGGTCHHGCDASKCFRVTHSGPLSGVYENDRWPNCVVAAFYGKADDKGSDRG